MYPIFNTNAFALLISIYCLQFALDSEAQDLSNIDKKNPIKVTGGISATQTLYNAWGIQNRRDPFYWLLNASLNFDILGAYIPFSVTLSQQNKTYTQPFNQFGLSPRYKAFTAHLGYRSMQFSNFTLGGNIFLGVGVEIAPQNSWIKVSTIYGRFTKAISVPETQGILNRQSAFERLGYGTKVTLGRQLNRSVDLIMFHGKDSYTSIPHVVTDSFKLKPAENLVLGIVTRQSITQKAGFDIEYSLSAYTEDTRLEKSEVEKYKYANRFNPIFQTNISTQFNKAILANLTFTEKLFQFRISYRRIDPEYKTMGSAFLNNDLQDITGNLSWRMFRNKMNFAVGSGVQKNNLDNALASKMNRFLGNINWSYTASRKLSFNAAYSNFTSNTKINNTRISSNQFNLTQNLDSLNYNQITNSANAGVNYNTGGEKVKHIAFSNGGYQRANDNHGNSSNFYNVSTGYQYTLVSTGLNITLSVNYNHSSIKESNTRSVGPNMAISKLLFKKAIRLTFGTTYLETYTNGIQTGNNAMLRFANTYKNGKHHSITMDMTCLTRNVKTGTGSSFAEFRGNLIYGYIF